MAEIIKKWYVVRAVSGKEKKVKEYLELEIARHKLTDYVSQVLIPTEKVFQIRNGKKIAIIGAGFSGIILAQKLKNIGEVKIFEKARGVGGRMASRTKDDFNFDFGAQFFYAKTAEFQEFLDNCGGFSIH